ncbi:hypothetical protein CACET_c31780 [Clostridium aceticum]|uniref:Uncharacterized protein n=1 Tax=Clostridium aceticum TaxID=84022 RepID=A0A0D8I750_9CLOT|nr:hypothetical protein [Clostridium aceticum]AKL96622.1 hypothetical protein CACET_c31780 [Clostridium aceticum]KJF26073.1 hypothetical protein TZ02_15240 [Clostridium aceticum]
MKPVFLRFTDDKGKVTKTFTVSNLKTGMMDNIFDIAERAENLQKSDVKISEVREFYKDLRGVIVAVFKGQFTYDELNENVENDELMKVFTALCSNISGEMKKN